MTSRRSFLQGAAAVMAAATSSSGLTTGESDAEAAQTGSGTPAIRLVGSFAYTSGSECTLAVALKHGGHVPALIIGEDVEIPDTAEDWFESIDSDKQKELGRIHEDFEKSPRANRLLCLTGWSVKVEESGSVALPLAVLPSIRSVFSSAKKEEAGAIEIGDKAGVEVRLHDGRLWRPAPTRSAGHYRLWQFRHGTVDHSEAMSMTDILEYTRSSPIRLTLATTNGTKNATIELTNSQRAWILNMPSHRRTADPSPNVLVHGDGFFDLFEKELPLEIPRAQSVGMPEKDSTTIDLGCVGSLVPPDIEFCYQAYLD